MRDAGGIAGRRGMYVTGCVGPGAASCCIPLGDTQDFAVSWIAKKSFLLRVSFAVVGLRLIRALGKFCQGRDSVYWSNLVRINHADGFKHTGAPRS